jgi:hypothetical protein
MLAYTDFLDYAFDLIFLACGTAAESLLTRASLLFRRPSSFLDCFGPGAAVKRVSRSTASGSKSPCFGMEDRAAYSWREFISAGEAWNLYE